MISSPKVSVVVPVYNGEAYLDQCLASVIEQEGLIECLMVDNGSTDGTRAICERYASQNPKFRYLQSKPKDLAMALRVGIANAQGEYIARLDSDDVALPGRLLLQMNYLDQNQQCVLVGGKMEYMSHAGQNLGIQKHFKYGKIELDDLYLGNPISHPTVMFKKSAYFSTSGYNSRWNQIEDLDLWFKFAYIGEIHNLNNCVTRYRIHQNQISISKTAMRKEITYRILRFAKMMVHHEKPERYQKNLVRILQVGGQLHPKLKNRVKMITRYFNE